MKFGLLLFPKLTQLDLTGPLEVFSRMNGVETALIWKTRDPVPSDRGMRILPTHTFDEARELDLIFCARRTRPDRFDGGPRNTELSAARRRAVPVGYFRLHGLSGPRRSRSAHGIPCNVALVFD